MEMFTSGPYFHCIICADRCSSTINLSTWWHRLLPLMAVQTTPPPSAQVCANCGIGIQQLLRLQGEVEKLQNQMMTMVTNIRERVTASQPQFFTIHLEDVQFREKLMGGVFVPQMPISSTYQLHSSTPQTNFRAQQPVRFSNKLPVKRTKARTGLDTFTVKISPGDFTRQPNLNGATEDGLQELENEEKNNFTEDNFDSISDAGEPISSKPKVKRAPRKRKKLTLVDRNANHHPKKKRQALPETFATKPLQISDNRWSFEGHEFYKLPTGFYTCHTCGFVEALNGENSMKMRTMKMHIYGVHLEKYKCDICQHLSFSSDLILRRHKKYKHPPPSEIAVGVPPGKCKCEICHKIIGIASLYLHNIQFHKKPEEKQALIDAGKYKQRFSPANCKFCQRSFNSGSNCSEHQRTCKKNPNPTPKFKVKSACSICGKDNISFLTEHLWIHKNAEEKEEARQRGEMPIRVESLEQKEICSSCGLLFKKSGLKMHMETHKDRNERKIVKCDFPQCDKEYTSKHALIKHTFLTHTPEKYTAWLKCTESGCSDKKFYDNNDLRIHYARFHMARKARSIACSICSAKFIRKGDLTCHMKVRHANRPNEVLKFVCPDSSCLQKLPTQATLKMHVSRIHPQLATKQENRVYDHPLPRKPCRVCNCPLSPQGLVTHCWIHKSVEEICTALNIGLRIPGIIFSSGKLAHIPKHHPSIRCDWCDHQQDLQSIYDLQDHIKTSHPDVHKLHCSKRTCSVPLDRIQFDVSDEGISVLSMGNEVVASLDPLEWKWCVTS